MLQLFKEMNKQQQIKTLKEWDKAYYELDDPIVADEDYDACLTYYNSKYPKEKYTSSLGAANNDFAKFEHQYPVLSLAKITTQSGYNEYGEKFDYNVLVEPKIDGLTVVYYPDGTLVSRGNGHIGEVLPNAKFIKGLPKPLDKPIRMEVCIEKDIYLVIPGVNKNPRNLAAGILRRKTQTDDIKYLTYYAYNILGSDLSEENQLITLRQNGFKTVDYIKLDGKEKFCEHFEKLDLMPSACLAPTDGVVIKCNNPSIALNMGMTAHHPNNMVAFKFESKVAETILTGIEWSRGRNVYTPVAVFEPVVLGGNKVIKASLHNLNIMKKLRVKINSVVTVTLKNEIIPQIIMSRDTDKSVAIDIPTICPFCGNDLVINKSEQLECQNTNCSYTNISDAKRFVSKEAMDVVGVSDALITKAVEAASKKSPVWHPLAIFNMDSEEISKALGITLYMATKIKNSYRKSLTDVDPARFLYACNVPELGINIAKDIMKYYNNDFYRFFKEFKETGMNVFGVGISTYTSIVASMNKIDNIKSIVGPEFIKIGAKKEEDNKESKVFSITGKLKYPRKYYVDIIEKSGNAFSSSVTKKVNYLVCGEDAGAKLEKAKSYGIKILSEDDFNIMFNKERTDV